MKKLIKGSLSITALVCLMFCVLLSCSRSSTADDNPKNPVNTVASVQTSATAGTWKITYFNDSGTDKTGNFSGYSFTFASNGTVTATNGTNTYSGAWSVTDSNSNDDSIGDLHFNLSFTAPPAFANLTEDWNFTEKSSTLMKLVHVSGGNGGTDYLTFTKN